MATVTQIVYTDDLTGETIEGEVQYAPIVFDGVLYDLHLSEDSYKKLLDALTPFIDGAESRRLPKDLRARMIDTNARHNRVPEHKIPVKSDREQTRAMRDWWKANATVLHEKHGLPLPKSDRGRVPASIADAYHKFGGKRVGNGKGEVAEAVAAVKAKAGPVEKPVEPRDSDLPYPVGDPTPEKPAYSTSGSRHAKKAKATVKKSANGHKKGPVPKDEFVAIVRQAGPRNIEGIRDAIETSGFKAPSVSAIRQRVASIQKEGLLS